MKKVKWDKTEHTFLNQLTLKRFYIRMGDILIKRNYLDEKDLVKVLKDIENSQDSRHIGNYLLDKNYINEDQLLESLADLNDTVYLKDIDLIKYVDSDTLIKHKQFLTNKKAVIILENKDDLVLAISYQISLEKRNKIKAYFNDRKVYFVFVKKATLENNLKLLDLDKVKIDDELI